MAKIRSFRESFSRAVRCAVCVVAVACAAGCGGGGGGSAPASPNPGDPPSAPGGGWAPGVFAPYTAFAGQCRVPRPGTNDLPGSTLTENNWLRSWHHELYLWYDEIVDRNPALYATPAYFDLLKTPELVDGKPKDRFHFSMPTEEWIALSQSGESAGYGVQWAVVSQEPPLRVVAAYVHPDSPAKMAGIERGTEVLEVDGVDLASVSSTLALAMVEAGLFPTRAGETHSFELLDFGATEPRTVLLTSEIVSLAPVQNVQMIETQHGTVGYLHFTDHIAIAEDMLFDAITELRDAGVEHLVLDIRYNGGGYLAIASQLAYMIAGPTHMAGRIFESMRFNDKHPTTNPVTREPLTPMPFIDVTVGFSRDPGEPLPTLNLGRVYVLTGSTTCSASESIINALRGIDVEVIQIGGTTCGKPYGFYPADNCGTTYFAIQFESVNEKGFAEYPNGFSPENTPSDRGVPVPGCYVADDFSKPLGDPEEARFAAALGHIAGEGCPPIPFGSVSGVSKSAAPVATSDGVAPKSPWLENRIVVVP